MNGRRGDYPGRIEFSLWKDKARKSVDPELFSTTAERTARALSVDRRRNKYSQLYRFYEEFLRCNSEASAEEKEFENTRALLHMLLPKAAYAEGRDLVSSEFTSFIKKGVTQIQDRRDLEIFSSFFEAVMGYYKQLNPKQ